MIRAATQRLEALVDGDRRHRGSAQVVAGIDEAGRGPLAGPVVAAAVILPDDPAALRTLLGLDDSKRLVPAERERLFAAIHRVALAVAVGQASPEEIDRLDILRATWCAMERAVDALPQRPDALLVDGHRVPPLGPRQRSVVGGDRTCLSIAAAGVVAKVTRDRCMAEVHHRHPPYRFDVHKGYGTAYHVAALDVWGPAPVHRRSFAPVAQRATPMPAPAGFHDRWQELVALADPAAWEAAACACESAARRFPLPHKAFIAQCLWQRARDLGLPPHKAREALGWAAEWLAKKAEVEKIL